LLVFSKKNILKMPPTLVDRPMMPVDGQKAGIVAPKNQQPSQHAIAPNGPGPNEKKDYVGNAGGLLKPGEKVLQLATFFVPLKVTNSEPYIVLGKAMINTWKRDGIFQVAMDKRQQAIAAEAMEQNRQFVLRPLEVRIQFYAEEGKTIPQIYSKAENPDIWVILEKMPENLIL
jgi:hypothetical protein